MRKPYQWRRRPTAGVSTFVAVSLLAGLTIVAGVILWTFRPPLPAQPITVTYQVVGNQSEPAWGDPTDCSNTTIFANCGVLPALFIIVTSHSPDDLPLKLLSFTFLCNGTVLLNGTLNALEVVPGSGASPSSGSPVLGDCGNWDPGPVGLHGTFFNRLAYFQQVQVGALILNAGDQLVVYGHAANSFKDFHGNSGDVDDWHGAPAWCFTVPGDCTIYLSFAGSPAGVVATIPLYGLSV